MTEETKTQDSPENTTPTGGNEDGGTDKAESLPDGSGTNTHDAEADDDTASGGAAE